MTTKTKPPEQEPISSAGDGGYRIIAVPVSKKELDAIDLYAKACGEKVPDLMRKSIIREATLADGFGPDEPTYIYYVKSANGVSEGRESKALEETYNQIRAILGWKRIEL